MKGFFGRDKKSISGRLYTLSVGVILPLLTR